MVRWSYEVGQDNLSFKLQDVMRYLIGFDDSCYFIDSIDGCVPNFV